MQHTFQCAYAVPYSFSGAERNISSCFDKILKGHFFVSMIDVALLFCYDRLRIIINTSKNSTIYKL